MNFEENAPPQPIIHPSRENIFLLKLLASLLNVFVEKVAG